MYSSRRYGGPNILAERAWETLHKSIYNCQDMIAVSCISFAFCFS